jgi:hypothetical protein
MKSHVIQVVAPVAKRMLERRKAARQGTRDGSCVEFEIGSEMNKDGIMSLMHVMDLAAD